MNSLVPLLLISNVVLGQIADARKADEDMVCELYRAVLLGDVEKARRLSLRDANLTQVTGSKRKEGWQEYVERLLEDCRVSHIKGNEEMRLAILSTCGIAVPVPLHREEAGFRCDPRWLVSAVCGKPSNKSELIAVRNFVAGLATGNPAWILKHAAPHEDLWMLSYGGELPGADQVILGEAAAATPFVMLMAGERYVDHRGEVQVVPEHTQIVYGVFTTVLALELVQVGVQWKIKPEPVLKLAAGSLKGVDQVAAKAEYRRELARAQLRDVLQGEIDMNEVKAFLKTHPEKPLKDEAIVQLARQAAIDSQFRSIEKTSVRAEVIQFLVKNGGNVDATVGVDTTTPLMFACSFAQDDSLELVRFLLELGADPAKKDFGGMSSLDYARCDGAKALIRKAIEARE